MGYLPRPKVGQEVSNRRRRETGLNHRHARAVAWSGGAVPPPCPAREQNERNQRVNTDDLTRPSRAALDQVVDGTCTQKPRSAVLALLGRIVLRTNRRLKESSITGMQLCQRRRNHHCF